MGTYDNLDTSAFDITSSGRSTTEPGDISAGLAALRAEREARKTAEADSATFGKVGAESLKSAGRGILQSVRGILGEYEITPEQRKDLEKIGVDYWKAAEFEETPGKALVETAIASDFLKANKEVLKDMSFIDQVVMAAPNMGIAAAITIATRKPKLGASYMGLQIMGGQIEDLTNQGVDLKTATKAGFVNALVQYPLESLGLSKASKLWTLRTAIAKRTTDILIAAGTEGLTEATQVLPERITDILAQNPDEKALRAVWTTLSDPSTYKQMGLEGSIGAIFGFAIGSGGAIRNMTLDEAAATIVEEDLTALPIPEEVTPEVDKKEELDAAIKKGKEKGKKAAKKAGLVKPKPTPSPVETPPVQETIEPAPKEDSKPPEKVEPPKPKEAPPVKEPVVEEIVVPEKGSPLEELQKLADANKPKGKAGAPKPVPTPPLTKLTKIEVLDVTGEVYPIGEIKPIKSKAQHTQEERDKLRDLVATAKEKYPNGSIGFTGPKGEHIPLAQVAKDKIGTKEELQEPEGATGKMLGERGAKAEAAATKRDEKRRAKLFLEAKKAKSLTKDQETQLNELDKKAEGAARNITKDNPGDFDDVHQTIREGLLNWVRLTPQQQKAYLTNDDGKVNPFSMSFMAKNAMNAIKGAGMGSEAGTREAARKGKIKQAVFDETKGASPATSIETEMTEPGGMTTPQEEVTKPGRLATAAQAKVTGITPVTGVEQETIEQWGKKLKVKIKITDPNATMKALRDRMDESTGPELTSLQQLKMYVEKTLLPTPGKTFDTSKLSKKEKPAFMAELRRKIAAEKRQAIAAKKDIYKKTPSRVAKFTDRPVLRKRQQQKLSQEQRRQDKNIVPVAQSKPKGPDPLIEAELRKIQTGRFEAADVAAQFPAFDPALSKIQYKNKKTKGTWPAELAANKALATKTKKEPIKYKYARVKKLGPNKFAIELRTPAKGYAAPTGATTPKTEGFRRVRVDTAIDRAVKKINLEKRLEATNDPVALRLEAIGQMRDMGLSKDQIKKGLEQLGIPLNSRDLAAAQREMVAQRQKQSFTKAQKRRFQKAKAAATKIVKGEGGQVILRQGSGRWRTALKGYQDYIKQNPDATVKDIMKDLGLSRYEVDTIRATIAAQPRVRPSTEGYYKEALRPGNTITGMAYEIGDSGTFTVKELEAIHEETVAGVQDLFDKGQFEEAMALSFESQMWREAALRMKGDPQTVKKSERGSVSTVSDVLGIVNRELSPSGAQAVLAESGRDGRFDVYLPDGSVEYDIVMETALDLSTAIAKKAEGFKKHAGLSIGSPKSLLSNKRGGGEEINIPGREELTNKAKEVVRIIKHYSGASKLHDKISVVAPWVRTGHKHVGRAVKNYFAIRVLHERAAENAATTLVKKIKQSYPKANKAEIREHLIDVVLAVEDRRVWTSFTDKEQAALRGPVTVMRSYFDNTLAKLKTEGLENTDFVGNRRNRLRETVKTTKDWNKRAKALHELTELNNIGFVHIPYSKWFPMDTKKLKTLNAPKRAALTLISQKKRHALSIQTLIDKELITREDIDPVTIILNYGSNIGRDMALLNIRNEAVKAGLAINQKKKPQQPKDIRDKIKNVMLTWADAKTPKQRAAIEKKIAKLQANLDVMEKIWKADLSTRWVQFPKSSKKYQAFDGYWVNERLVEGIDAAFAVDGSQGKWATSMAITKMAQFYNPLFMPMYDLHQAAAMGGLVTRPDVWGRGLAKALHDINTNSQDFQRATERGVFSQPFANPSSDFKTRVRDILATTKYNNLTGTVLDTLMSRLNRIPGDFDVNRIRDFKTPIGNAVMDSSWRAAWKMDEFIRMGTYNSFIEMGMTTDEAAESAAKIHADYADVPATTRKMLNQFFFTPTFAISMTKVHSQMLNSILKMAVRSGRGSRINTRLAWGAAVSVGALAGITALMNMMGYETDQWGRRWVRKTRTPDGVKETVITLASPVNKTLKYAYWLMDFGDASRSENPVGRVLRQAKMESGPLIKTILSVADNKKMDGGPVYNTFDDTSTQIADAGVFAIEELIGITDSALARVARGKESARFSNRRERTRKKLESELNGFIKALSFVQTFHVYSRSGPKQRYARDIQRVNSEFGRAVFNAAMSGQEYNKNEWKKNYRRRIAELQRIKKLRRRGRRSR